MRKPNYILSIFLLVAPISNISSSPFHHEDAIIHDTCKKTHMYGHCVQAIRSYELFEFTDHSTPLKIANILVYVTGVQQAIYTLQRIDELIVSSSRGEWTDYIENLKACKEKYESIYDPDYFTAWINMANGNYGASESVMWTARERAISCEKGFGPSGKYPITDMNDKMQKLALIAVDVLRLLE
ncbi:hypothetical protein QQ045_010606 [Rhodiola kirilowii]